MKVETRPPYVYADVLDPRPIYFMSLEDSTCISTRGYLNLFDNTSKMRRKRVQNTRK